MIAQVCVRKQDRFMVKNSRNFFEITLKNSPFDMKVLAQKHVKKTLREMRKTGSKTSLKSYVKLIKRTPFYRDQKYSHWGSE